MSAMVASCSVSPTSTPPSVPIPNVQPVATGMTGEWMLTIESPMGRDDVEARFAQNGSDLSGTVFTQGREVPIEGTVNGNQVDFGMALDVRGEPLKLDYSGTIEGDNLSGTVRFGPIGNGKFSAKRKEQAPAN
jgi:hypothetical protein